MYILALYDVPEYKENYMWIPLTILLIIVILAMLVMMKGLMQKREFINLDNLISTNLQTKIEEKN